jgi:adenylylsulfate kinase
VDRRAAAIASGRKPTNNQESVAVNEVRGVTVWFTGLSGAGKSTISEGVHRELKARSTRVELLDGDLVRQNLSKGLGFSKEDRDINIRRIGFVADLLTRNGVTVLVAAISPYREARDEVRAQIGDFLEIHVAATLDTLVDRDVKGLYRKALAGELANFTGVSDPYEAPTDPELVIHTDHEKVQTSIDRVLDLLDDFVARRDGQEVRESRAV